MIEATDETRRHAHTVAAMPAINADDWATPDVAASL